MSWIEVISLDSFTLWLRNQQRCRQTGIAFRIVDTEWTAGDMSSAHPTIVLRCSWDWQTEGQATLSYTKWPICFARICLIFNVALNGWKFKCAVNIFQNAPKCTNSNRSLAFLGRHGAERTDLCELAGSSLPDFEWHVLRAGHDIERVAWECDARDASRMTDRLHLGSISCSPQLQAAITTTRCSYLSLLSRFHVFYVMYSSFLCLYLYRSYYHYV